MHGHVHFRKEENSVEAQYTMSFNSDIHVWVHVKAACMHATLSMHRSVINTSSK